MKTRPWPLVVLAILQILSPLASILISAIAYQTSPFQVLYWLFQRPALEIFEFFCLMPIAGIAIYQVKKWSYAVFAIAMLWSFWTKISHWDYAMSNVNASMLFGVYFLQFGIALYFVLPSVRRTYFDPTVRWWETLPRYLIMAPAKIQLGDEEKSGEVCDLSEGGARIRCADPLSKGQEVRLMFSVLTRSFSVSGQVMHALETEGRRT